MSSTVPDSWHDDQISPLWSPKNADPETLWIVQMQLCHILIREGFSSQTAFSLFLICYPEL